MDPEDFQKAWQANGDLLTSFSPLELANLDIPDATRTFLSATGLPKAAAPFLDFALGNLDWLPVKVEGYSAIGSNGYGDPIVISNDGTVYYLDHDHGSEAVYINSNVSTLAACLLKYRELGMETCRLNGPDAFLDGNIPFELANGFRDFVSEIDAAAFDDGNMWPTELANFQAQ
jgi:hypothetical protein